MKNEKKQKLYKLSKLREKGLIIRCSVCEGEGKWHGHGAFGESEITPCGHCSGTGKVLNWAKIDKEN